MNVSVSKVGNGIKCTTSAWWQYIHIIIPCVGAVVAGASVGFGSRVQAYYNRLIYNKHPRYYSSYPRSTADGLRDTPQKASSSALCTTTPTTAIARRSSRSYNTNSNRALSFDIVRAQERDTVDGIWRESFPWCSRSSARAAAAAQAAAQAVDLKREKKRFDMDDGQLILAASDSCRCTDHLNWNHATLSHSCRQGARRRWLTVFMSNQRCSHRN